MSAFPVSVFNAFAILGDFRKASPYGSGHINDTFAATISQSGTLVRYLFQRINQQIFQDVPGLMDNIQRVTEHSQKALKEMNDPDRSRHSLSLVKTQTGAAYHVDETGAFWRCYLFVEDATGYDIIETTQQAFEAAQAFGQFQKLLVDLPGERLNETIPDFHNTPKRLETFIKTLEKDTLNRAGGIKKEIDWIMSQSDLADSLLKQHRAGDIPERITHNDTKLNNVLIDDRTMKAACVIDLDTLMPGLALYDFGDLVRTSTSPVAEDEVDTSLIKAQPTMFKALVDGYLSSAGEFLTKAEKESLPLSGQVITYECGIRFLTDYLQGDTYFKVKREGHNLDRFRSQMALVKNLQEQHESFMNCVNTISSQIV